MLESCHPTSTIKCQSYSPCKERLPACSASGFLACASYFSNSPSLLSVSNYYVTGTSQKGWSRGYSVHLPCSPSFLSLLIPTSPTRPLFTLSNLLPSVFTTLRPPVFCLLFLTFRTFSPLVLYVVNPNNLFGGCYCRASGTS